MTQQSASDLFDYLDSPGHKRRDTAREAAEHIAKAAPVLRAKCLAVLERSNGLTADEVAGRLGVSILSIRPRLTELSRAGQVRDSGHRRANASGRSAIVWAAINPSRLQKAS